MSNHTIEAKNKASGIIFEFTAIDSPYGIPDYYLNSLNKSYTDQEFNDLFEVVEDKLTPFISQLKKDLPDWQFIVEDNVIDTVPELKLGKTRLKPLDFGVQRLTPQTDTLKKDELSRQKIRNILAIVDIDIAIDHMLELITQEIAKAKKEEGARIVRMIEKLDEQYFDDNDYGFITKDGVLNIIKNK
jgi:hypothetical protein